MSFYNHFNNIEQRTKKFWVASQSGPLKDLAMAVLSAPGSNSYVERIFSRVKDITVERRASLRPRTVISPTPIGGETSERSPGD